MGVRVKSDRTLKAYYRDINTRFFDNELPDSVCVRWATDEDLDDEGCDAGDYNGWADTCDDGRHPYKIIIDSSLRGLQIQHISTLVHEMIHIATELKDDHGPAFERRLAALADRGIFKKGALRRGLTLF
jgi:hypothetical protein